MSTPTHDETPSDGYGPGYFAHHLREDFRNLCRFVGKEEARQITAEIINSEFERKVIEHA